MIENISSTTAPSPPVANFIPCVQVVPVLPRDVFLMIFSLLSFRDLSRCMRVCRAWKDLTNDDKFWKKVFFRCSVENAIDDFQPLVNEGIVTWKEAFRFSKISSLFAKIFEVACTSDSKIIPRDMLIEDVTSPIWYHIPKFMIRHGNLDFTIVNSIDVRMINIKTKEVQILKGESDARLTHLAVDRGFVFTLRTDGVVVQWDYRKKEIVQIIESSYAQKDSRFDNLRLYLARISETLKVQEAICDRKCFEVNNGYIFLKYRTFNERYEEVIPYLNVGQRNVIDLPRKNLFFTEFYKKNNFLFTWQNGKLIRCNFLKDEQLRTVLLNESWCFSDLDVEQNILCTLGSDGRMKLLDLSSGKSSFRSGEGYSYYSYFTKFTVIGNLCIGVKDNGSKELFILDLNTGHLKGKADDFFDFVKGEINKKAFKALIQYCQVNISRLEITKNPIARAVEKLMAIILPKGKGSQ